MHPRRHPPLVPVLSAVCTLAFVIAVIPRAATPANADDSQDVTISEAVAQAEQTGQPVLATAETTESGSLTANPDGTLTVTLGAGPLQEPDPDSSTGWSPIDLTLHHEDGTYTPSVSAADTSFSDGGSGALATLDDGSKTYTENWDGSLPTPNVSGTTATYPNVLPNIDLVMQAQTAGFKQSFVVHSAPSQPLVLDVPLSLRGLSASVDEKGNLIVTDSHGNTVATSGTAVMYGAATDPSGEPTISETVDTAIVNVGGTPVFRITPDQSFFSNPELTYPVTIDPSPNLSVTTDTYVKSTAAGSSFLTDNGLKVGTPDGSEIDRTLIKFPALDGTYRGNSNAIDVSAATLTLHQVDATTCTASEIDLYQATSNWITAGGPTWNNQPTIGTMYASASFAAGHSGCSEADETISTGGASGHTLKDLVQAWADGTSTNYGLELKAASESSTSGYKKFRSSDYGSNAPTLSVTYNTQPDVPSSLSVTDGTTWAPTLHATFYDPDGGTGHVVYSVYDSNNTYIAGGSGATVSSGSDSSFTLSGLTDPDTLTWTAVSTDGTDSSAATTSQSLTFNPSSSDEVNCNADVGTAQATFVANDESSEIPDTYDGYANTVSGPDNLLDDSYCQAANSWEESQGTSPAWFYHTKGERDYGISKNDGNINCTVKIFGNQRYAYPGDYMDDVQAKIRIDCTNANGDPASADLYVLDVRLVDVTTATEVEHSPADRHVYGSQIIRATNWFNVYPPSQYADDTYQSFGQVKICFGSECHNPGTIHSNQWVG